MSGGANAEEVSHGVLSRAWSVVHWGYGYGAARVRGPAGVRAAASGGVGCQKAAHRPLPPDVLLGPAVGEDACALDVDAGVLIAATDPITLTTSDLGRYGVIVNANDVAVMGVRPRWFLAAVLLPLGTTADAIEQLFASMRGALGEVGATLVGGHTEVTGAVGQPRAASPRACTSSRSPRESQGASTVRGSRGSNLGARSAARSVRIRGRHSLRSSPRSRLRSSWTSGPSSTVCSARSTICPSATTHVRNRDGDLVRFEVGRIEYAIERAAHEVGDPSRALSSEVATGPPGVEETQDEVERQLFVVGHDDVARAFSAYRHRRADLRRAKAQPEVRDELKLGLAAVTVLRERYLRKS